MNKKLVLVAVMVFAFAGLMLSHTVKAQDDNSTNSDNSMNADNSAAPAQ